MGSRRRVRQGLSGLAALALLTSACGSSGPDRPAPAVHEAAGERRSAALDAVALASVHRELPPPPSIATSQLTVAVTHPGGVRDPGLDAAVAALRQRPDLNVVVVAPDRGDPDLATTMSGDPARTVAGDVVDAVASVTGSPDHRADLVVIGVDVVGGADGHRSGEAARLAASNGVPAIQVNVEGADGADYAAATMQLLEVLDFGLAAMLEADAQAVRLTVPSCRSGTLRGRVDVGRAQDDSSPDVVSDCLADAPADADERGSFSAGYATLAELR